jgi:hypothetical protein
VAAAAGGFIRSIFQARGKLDDDEQYCGNYAFAGSRAHEIAPRAEKNGMRCVMIELRNEEIEALIRKQLLKPEMRNDREAIAAEGPEAAPPALAPVAPPPLAPPAPPPPWAKAVTDTVSKRATRLAAMVR